MSLKQLAKQVRTKGRHGDTELVHMTRGEVAGLSALAKQTTGKALPRNPHTGLPEANILKSMLPTILGAAASFVGTPALGAAVGAAAGAAMNPNDRWGGAAMGALGGYGGGQLATGLMQAGANAGAQATAQGALQATTSTAPQQIAAMESMGLSAQEAAKTAAASQAAAQTTAQTAATTNAPLAADAAGRFAQAGQGFQSLGSLEGMSKFVGTAASQGATGSAAQGVGMGGGYNTAMAVGKAAAPALMAPPSGGGSEEEDYGELPKYRFDRKRGSGYAPGAGASSEQRWFDDSFVRLAEGGEVDAGPTAKTPAPKGGFIGRTEPQYSAVVGPGTHSDGMSGMSKDAFEYLMGRGTVKTPAPAAAPVPPPDIGVPPASGGFMGPGPQPGAVSDMTGYSPTPSRGYVNEMQGYGPGFMIGNAPSGVGDTIGGMSLREQQLALQNRGFRTRYAEGGTVDMQSDGFVIPADVVSAVGSGSSNAGIEILAKRLGAKPINGAGDGQSDSIPARIDGKHPARVARDEMYLSPQQVEQAGGAKKLYAMMDRIRKDATGSKQQMRPVKLHKAIK